MVVGNRVCFTSWWVPRGALKENMVVDVKPLIWLGVGGNH